MSAFSSAVIKEAPVFFQAGEETLFGIMTEPQLGARNTGVVLLRGAGQGHSAGRDQVLARVCRRLAEGGYPSLRFDYRGVGESTGSVERFSLDHPFVEDLDAAIGCLRQEGIEEVILIGGCFGGRTALAAARTIEQLAGLVFLTLPVRDKEKDDAGTRNLVPDRTWWQYARRLVRPHVVRGLLQREQRRTYVRVMRSAWLGRRSQQVTRTTPITPRWLSPMFVAACQNVVERQIPTLIVAGTEDPGHEDFLEAMSGDLGEVLQGKSQVEIKILGGRVEAFADAELHPRLLTIVSDWISERETR